MKETAQLSLAVVMDWMQALCVYVLAMGWIHGEDWQREFAAVALFGFLLSSVLNLSARWLWKR